MIDLTRRRFVKGLGLLGVAPLFVRPGLLMPIKARSISTAPLWRVDMTMHPAADLRRPLKYRWRTFGVSRMSPAGRITATFTMKGHHRVLDTAMPGDLIELDDLISFGSEDSTLFHDAGIFLGPASVTFPFEVLT